MEQNLKANDQRYGILPVLILGTFSSYAIRSVFGEQLREQHNENET